MEQLEADLKEGNPANSGLSARNLWYTLKFYNTYREDTILQRRCCMKPISVREF